MIFDIDKRDPTWDSWFVVIHPKIGNLIIDHLVGGWATPLKNMKVSWDD